jgi:dTDP-4-amino-4,6-dideoxygalactose transaminase
LTPVDIPLFDTRAQLDEVRAEIEQRVLAVIDSGRFVLGPEVEAFERELAEFLGASHVVGVGNGTDALTIGLRALGITPGDEVIVPSFTFYATAEAVVNAGARPVFCDIDPRTFCISADTVAQVVSERTRAVVPVHLFGIPAPMDDIAAFARERGFRVLEDAAQAAGARLGGRNAGTLGDAAAFSFFPSKNLFCLGDGGALVTDDDEVAERARLLRLHGSRDKSVYLEVGYNSRLDSIQAAALRVVLPRLHGWNERRRALAAAYADAGLGEVARLPEPPPGADPAHHMYVVRSEDRDALRAALASEGVETRVQYAVPVHRQPAMAAWGAMCDLPGTEEAARTNLAFPMGPTLAPDTARTVVAAARRARSVAPR